MFILILGALVLIAFLLRVRPRLSQKNFGIDSWYFLLYADEFRKTKKIPVKFPYFMLDIEEQRYPPALPMLLALFPQKFLEQYHWAISAFLDTVQMVVLYLISYALSKNLLFSSLAALFYAASPILVTQNSNLNSRALGALFLTLILVSLYGYIVFTSFLFLALSIIFGVMLLHTHKLATQQMVFILIGFSIIYLNPVYAYILIGIFLSAVIVSGGFYVKIMNGHMEILKFWNKNLNYLWSHQIYESPIYLNKMKVKTMKGCGGIASNKLWLRLAKLQFAIIAAAIIFCVFIYRRSLTVSDIFFIRWFFINIFCIIIISYFKPLKFLGEGQRYFTYGIFPASFLLLRFAFLSLGVIAIIVFVCLAVIFIINLALIMKIHNEQKKNILAAIDSELEEMLSYIKDLPRDNIMSFPVSYCEHIAYFCKKKTLWGAHGSGYDRLQDFFPILLKPIEYFINYYGISYCLLNEKYALLNDIKPSINYKIIKENAQYRLLEFIDTLEQ